MHILDKEKKFSEFSGYKITVDKYGHLKSMENGNRHIWPILINRYDIGFQTADLINGYYCNHRKYKSLINALNRYL